MVTTADTVPSLMGLTVSQERQTNDKYDIFVNRQILCVVGGANKANS